MSVKNGKIADQNETDRGMKVTKAKFKFHGGVHPPYNKELARDKAVESLPMPKELVVSMAQHLGAPAKCLVKAGDHVVKGQLIGEKNGFISVNVHASASGIVKAVEKRIGPAGGMADHVILTPDAEQGEMARMPPLDWKSASREELLKRVEDAGICGMGGAGLKTAMVLFSPKWRICMGAQGEVK
jgi:electron transport complex protein RnfC